MKKNNARLKNQKKSKSLGQFKVLSEKEETHVRMDIDMTKEFRDNLEKRGREVAEDNTEFYINLGFNDLLMKYVQQKEID